MKHNVRSLSHLWGHSVKVMRSSEHRMQVPRLPAVTLCMTTETKVSKEGENIPNKRAINLYIVQ